MHALFYLARYFKNNIYPTADFLYLIGNMLYYKNTYELRA